MAYSVINAHSAVTEASNAKPSDALKALWQASGWIPQEALVVDGRHLVQVFHVDHSPSIARGGIPAKLLKYSDNEAHAPYRADCLKLATLGHYRDLHRDLEGTRDRMEGKSRIASTMEEFCRRHGVSSVPAGAHHVKTKTTYGAEDTSLIYCTTKTNLGASRPAQWMFASYIRDVPKFALLLGTEFARQCDDGRLAAVTGLDCLVSYAVQASGLDSIVHVHHGPVVYDDQAGEILFTRYPGHARGLAAHFFKRTTFENQREYRFVVTAQGRRPVADEFYLKIAPDLRRVFEKRGLSVRPT